MTQGLNTVTRKIVFLRGMLILAKRKNTRHTQGKVDPVCLSCWNIFRPSKRRADKKFTQVNKQPLHPRKNWAGVFVVLYPDRFAFPMAFSQAFEEKDECQVWPREQTAVTPPGQVDPVCLLCSILLEVIIRIPHPSRVSVRRQISRNLASERQAGSPGGYLWCAGQTCTGRKIRNNTVAIPPPSWEARTMSPDQSRDTEERESVAPLVSSWVSSCMFSHTSGKREERERRTDRQTEREREREREREKKGGDKGTQKERKKHTSVGEDDSL